MAARPWYHSRWLPWLIIAVCLLPAGWGVYAIYSDFAYGTVLLGAEPKRELEHYYGDWILRFLVVTLVVTPVRQITGWNWLQKYRRRFGLVAFTYACLHITAYLFVDMQFEWALIGEDIAKRPYITIGMAAFLMLITLASTSTTGSIRRLGKRWVKLHRLVYVIVVLGTIHFWMSVKKDIREPLMYALIFAVLLGYRAWHALRSRSSRRGSNPSPQPNSAPSA